MTIKFNFDFSSDHPWYVLQCPTGKEKVVAEALSAIIKSDNLSDVVSGISVPEETIQVIRSGKVINKKKCTYSGYIYIKAKLTLKVKNMIHTGVTDPNSGKRLFIKFPFQSYSNGKKRILPLSTDEITQIGLEPGNNVSKPVVKPSFNINDKVEIISGAFKNYKGILKSYNDNTNTVEVEFPVFGRPQTVSFSIEDLKFI